MYPPQLPDPTQVGAVDPLLPGLEPPVDAPIDGGLVPPAAPVDPLALPPLTEAQRGAVRQWLAAAEEQQRRYSPLWKRNLDAYAPSPETLNEERDTYEVNTNVDFRQAEQKKAQLWFDTADVRLTPIEPLADTVLAQIPMPDGTTADEQLSTAINLHQTVLTQILGPDGVRAKATIQRAILDVLVPSGWGVTEIGYTSHTRPVEHVDPMTGAPMTVEVPIFEEYFWQRVSPQQFLPPPDFRSVEFDKAPWLALRFRRTLSEVKREYKAAIPDDYRGATIPPADPMRDDKEARAPVQPAFDPYVDGYKFYYYEPTLNPDALHPRRCCEIVLLHGLDVEVRHRYCPYQSLDAQGRLTADSMQGYPIHVLTLREVPDDNHVPSDSSMTRPLTDELNQFRSQVLKSRDASIPYAFYDQDILSPEKIERITNGDYGPMIPVEGGRLNAANPPVMPGLKPQLSRETYAGQDVIERDIERTLALGSNQTGATTATRRTATEIATMQQSVDTRLAGEQARVVDFFITGVRKLDALVQRYSDESKIIAILGPEGTQRWIRWDKTMLAGRFAYTIRPDSQIHVDAAVDRQQDLAFYNLTARDPYINRMELNRRLAMKWGFNPDKLIQPPPPTGPPPPNVQVRVQASDLDPRLPQFPLVLEILTQSGYQISPEALENSTFIAGKATAIGQLPDDVTPPKDTVAPPDQTHPGPAEKTEPVDKHAQDTTGRLEGGGAEFAAKP